MTRPTGKPAAARLLTLNPLRRKATRAPRIRVPDDVPKEQG